MPDNTVAVHAPYEEAILAIVGLISKVVDSQPKEVQAELWKMYLEDWKAWREFWKTVAA